MDCCGVRGRVYGVRSLGNRCIVIVVGVSGFGWGPGEGEFVCGLLWGALACAWGAGIWEWVCSERVVGGGWVWVGDWRGRVCAVVGVRGRVYGVRELG